MSTPTVAPQQPIGYRPPFIAPKSRVIEVVETTYPWGQGTPDDPVRTVHAYWDPDQAEPTFALAIFDPIAADVNETQRLRRDLRSTATQRDNLNSDLTRATDKINRLTAELLIAQNELHDFRNRASLEPRAAIEAILAERSEQHRQWGGALHDDHHSWTDWARFLTKQMKRLRTDVGNRRSRYVKIAALALAAIESHDRRNASLRTAEAWVKFKAAAIE